ncbi:hypothetical protein Poly30_40800 [Planctomycetes bacterium Poly30]|uniref:Glycosyltransferase RgtA/B/C/D-like domain-containing protein n=1 Tax=Saltatorellus ferox TaxID=2528018 RepID=A0A518EWR1_9BACT|nr:hypothetical protein Poly30_40800 [Planctomycetes bacterium Poly30]
MTAALTSPISTVPNPVSEAAEKSPIQRGISAITLLLLWATAILGAVFIWRTFSEYIFEDAYITYRYADNIANGRGFVFTEGERVLGTTAPLYTLILALLGFLGADIPTASGLLFVGAIATVGLLGGFMLRGRGAPILGVAFAVFCSAGGPELYRFFGLETPFLIALLMGAVWAATLERFRLGAVLVAFAFLTRYDAALFAILYFGLLAWRDRRVPVRLGLLSTALVLPWLAFAQWYFGSVFPNTLGAKTGDTGPLTYLTAASARQWELSTSWLKRPGPWDVLGDHASLVLALVLGAGVIAGFVVALRERSIGTRILALYPLALMAGYSLIGPSIQFLWYPAPATYCAVLLSMLGLASLLKWLRILPLTEVALLPVLYLVAVAVVPHVEQKEKMFSDGGQYRYRVEAYETMARFVVSAGLSDQALLTLEPGYFAYLSDNPAIDQAGLVTKGIYFHGSSSRRTTLQEILEERQPGLFVCGNGRMPKGYLTVFTAGTRFELGLRKEVLDARFDSILGGARNVGDSDAPDIASPFEFRLDRRGRHHWIEQGGIATRVGALLKLDYDGQPYEDEFMLVGPGEHGAESPSFRIDFDSLEFLLAAKSEILTGAQLLVDGQAVLSSIGHFDAEDPRFERVVFDLAPWRGRVASIRFTQWAGAKHAVAFNEVRSRTDAERIVFDDFESGGSVGAWAKSFTEQPASLREAARAHGLHIYSSEHAAMSRGLEGELEQVSEPFVIEHDEIRFRMLDFGDELTSVTLLVDGQAVRTEQGNESEDSLGIFWDVSEFRGKQAVLEIVDHATADGLWVGIDDIVFATMK